MSHRITLPITRWERMGAVALIVGATVAAANSPVAPVWRVVIAVLTVLVGSAQWWRYSRRRPRALLIADDNALVVERKGGALVGVDKVRTGVVRPTFVSARLYLTSGERTDLVLSGREISAQDHWHVRRALLGHRTNPNSG